jgi:hypothetical protein
MGTSNKSRCRQPVQARCDSDVSISSWYSCFQPHFFFQQSSSFLVVRRATPSRTLVTQSPCSSSACRHSSASGRAEGEADRDTEQRVHADQTSRPRSGPARAHAQCDLWPVNGGPLPVRRAYSSCASRLISRRRWSHWATRGRTIPGARPARSCLISSLRMFR